MADEVVVPATKICAKCRDPKPLDGGFRACADTRDKLRGTCRECESSYFASRRAQIKPRKWDSVELLDKDEELTNAIAEAVGIAAFGTAIETECADACVRHMSVIGAAVELRLTPAQVRAHLGELQRRAAKRGYAPSSDMQKPTPVGFHVKGVSNYYKVDPVTGESQLTAQWVKTNADAAQQMEAWLDAMSGIVDKWQGAADPVAATTTAHNDDLLAVYPLGDPHLGMFAYAAETGNNFDLKIAEQNLCAAMDHLVALAPPAREGLIIGLGDMFHADSSANQTMRSHNALDVDTRWSKILGVGVRAMRRLIDQALTKHEHVTVIVAVGNHDDHSAVFLAIALQQFYEREPRVTVMGSESKFHWYRFGQNLIGVTHGDTVKYKDLPSLMACDRAKDWGETKYRAWYCGHVHHDQLKEFPGVTVETFRTLAGRDAWHHAAGYRAQRDAKLIVLHREHGEIMRHIVGINQICWDN